MFTSKPNCYRTRTGKAKPHYSRLTKVKHEDTRFESMWSLQGNSWCVATLGHLFRRHVAEDIVGCLTKHKEQALLQLHGSHVRVKRTHGELVRAHWRQAAWRKARQTSSVALQEALYTAGASGCVILRLY